MQVIREDIISDVTIAYGKYVGSTHENENQNGQTMWVRGKLYLETLKPDNLNMRQYARKKGFIFTVASKVRPKYGRHYSLVGYIVKTTFDSGFSNYSFKATSIIPEHLTKDRMVAMLRNHASENIITKFQDMTKNKNASEILLAINTNEKLMEAFTKHEQTLLRQTFADDNDLAKEYVKAQMRPFFPGNNQFSTRMYDVYGLDAEKTLRKNPWAILTTIPYMRLDICDTIAEQLGISLSDPNRMIAILKYGFESYLKSTGNTLVSYSELDMLFQNKLQTDMSYDEFLEIMNNEENDIIKSEIGYHLKEDYTSEKDTFDFIQTRYQTQTSLPKDWFNDYAEQSGLKLTQEQKQAVETSLGTNLFLLTGGPGVGKTTTLQALIEANKEMFGYKNHQIMLMAPTGKAAQRMSESCGPSSTIHKALFIIPELGFIDYDMTIQSLKEKQVKVFIIDEASMLDTQMAGNVFKIANELNIRVFLIGDVNQLPSIGGGQVLEDLLTHLPHCNLTKIQRQAEDSSIIQLSQMIAKGQFPSLDWFSQQTDVYFVEQTTDVAMSEYCDNLFTSATIRNRPTILTPYKNQNARYKYDTTGYFNELMQKHVNTHPEFISSAYINPYGDKEFGKTYKLGDRVMSLVNFDENIVNGGTGYITNLNVEKKNLTVTFDTNSMEATLNEQIPIRTYEYEQLSELSLAYSLTIHKSQGSEYDFVMIPLVRQGNTNFLTRNLLYTAITRAKRRLLLVGSWQAFAIAAATPNKKRTTYIQYLYRRP